MRALLLGLLLTLAVAAPAGAADDRLRQLSVVETAILTEPGALLAGDVPVVAAPRKLYGWPAGRPAVLSRLPDLGPVEVADGFPDGDIRVWSAQPDRVAVARSNGAAVDVDFDAAAGHQLVVGPPRGPWHDPAGCGEAAGGPAWLDGDRLAYLAAPPKRADEEEGETERPAPACTGAATPAVTRRSLVVRDLATGDAVVAVVPLPKGREDLERVRLNGPYLAYAWSGPEEAGDSARGVAVVDLRDGHQLVAARPVDMRQWALLPDGGLVIADPPARVRDDELCTEDTRTRLLRAGAAPQALEVRPCLFSVFDVRDGKLVFGQRRTGGRIDTVALDIATGVRERLATTSGGPVDVSATRLVLDDETCSSGLDLRIAARTTTPIRPAGPRRCPARIGRLRRSGEGFTLGVRCPIGCRLEVRGPGRDDLGLASPEYFDVTPRMRRLSLGGRTAPANPVVRVAVLHPVGRPTRVVRRPR